MHDYSFLRTPKAKIVTDDERAAFALARADAAERNAAEWDGRDDRMAPVYAERFRNEAAQLRAEAASLRGEA